MLGNLGYAEVIIICFLALLLFGAKRLPEIGQSFGKSIRMFKKGVKDIQDEIPSPNELHNESSPAGSGSYNAETSSNVETSSNSSSGPASTDTPADKDAD